MARGTFFEEDEQAKLDVEAAVFHDTLLVLAEAVKMLNFHAFLGATDVSCSAEKSWESGATFYNYINAVETNGITGNIRFKVKKSRQETRLANFEIPTQRLCSNPEIMGANI